MTISEAFENFIFSRKLRGLSPKTIDCYRDFIKPFINYVGASLSIEKLSRQEIETYIYFLFQKNLSMATIATYIRHIKIFLQWIEIEYGLEIKSKSIVVPKSPKKIVHIYSNQEIILIYNAIDTSSKWITQRNKAIVSLMLDSGLRQNEVCTLLNKDIYFDTRMAKVVGKGSKERLIPIGNTTIFFLHDYLSMCPYDNDYTFISYHGNPLTCNAVKLLITKLSDRLSFDISSHKLRHNFATNYCINQYEQNGHIDIFRLMSIMGHENIATTQKYLHYAMDIIAAKANISHIDNIFTEYKL